MGRRVSSLDSTSVSISREIDSRYDHVHNVSENIDDIVKVANNFEKIKTASEQLGDLNAISNAAEEIKKVSSDIEKLKPVGEHITKVVKVSNDLANIDKVHDKLAPIERVATSADKVDRVATSADKLDKVHDHLDKVDTVGAALDNADSSLNKVHKELDKVTKVADVSEQVKKVSLITDEVTNLSAIKDKLVQLSGDKATLDSLFADRAKLNSLFADKATLDSIYGDKAKLDSIFQDKHIFNWIFSNKATLQSIFDDKAKLDSLFADKALLTKLHSKLTELVRIHQSITNLDRLFSSISNLDRVHQSITNLDRVFNSIANIDEIKNHIAAIDKVAPKIDKVATVADNIEAIKKTQDYAADAKKLAINPEDVQYTLSDNTTGYSCMHYAVRAKRASDNAATSENIAKTHEKAALNSSTAANTAEVKAKQHSNKASSSATAAEGYYTKAAKSAVAAELSEKSCTASLKNMRETWLGSYDQAPTATADGTPIKKGMVYYNTSTDILYYYVGNNKWKDVTQATVDTFTRYNYILAATNRENDGRFKIVGADKNNKTLEFKKGLAQVFLNGVLLELGIDYTEDSANANTLLLGTGVGNLQDEVTVISYRSATFAEKLDEGKKEFFLHVRPVGSLFTRDPQGTIAFDTQDQTITSKQIDTTTNEFIVPYDGIYDISYSLMSELQIQTTSTYRITIGLSVNKAVPSSQFVHINNKFDSMQGSIKYKFKKGDRLAWDYEIATQTAAGEDFASVGISSVASAAHMGFTYHKIG